MQDNRAAFQKSADVHREGDVVLRDGSTVRTRVMRPTDEVGLRALLLRDVSVRLTPLSNEDALEMIRELKTYPLLTGFRGSVPAVVTALEEGLLRVSAMVEDLPQIAELDCNPFVVHETGATILDARIRVTAGEPRPTGGRPSLSSPFIREVVVLFAAYLAAKRIVQAGD